MGVGGPQSLFVAFSLSRSLIVFPCVALTPVGLVDPPALDSEVVQRSSKVDAAVGFGDVAGTLPVVEGEVVYEGRDCMTG